MNSFGRSRGDTSPKEGVLRSSNLMRGLAGIRRGRPESRGPGREPRHTRRGLLTSQRPVGAVDGLPLRGSRQAAVQAARVVLDDRSEGGEKGLRRPQGGRGRRFGEKACVGIPLIAPCIAFPQGW